MASFHSPIEQFIVRDYTAPLFEIAGHSITFTNFALAAVLALVLGAMFMILPMMKRSVIPSRWQAVVETFYDATESILLEAAGPKGKPFLPFIFTIFLFILLCNLLGLVPMLYTVTSQLVVNLALGLMVILIVLGAGFAKHGLGFLKLFVPSGVPPILVPVLAPIEFVSFFVRPFSLALRLFGNMLAGHVLLKVFAGMTAAVATSGLAAASGFFPVVMNVGIVGFEVFVAFLQAYIFTVLSSLYLRDALEMH
ncbi:MAG TPA: F0F1 ATP synthase subunit A [Rhodospirillaceae bacterium]|nr:F0F1 ATP synthase subunit A [Rhodospirillaceae bacterium]